MIGLLPGEGFFRMLVDNANAQRDRARRQNEQAWADRQTWRFAQARGYCVTRPTSLGKPHIAKGRPGGVFLVDRDFMSTGISSPW